MHRAKSHLILTPLGTFGIAKQTDYSDVNAILKYVDGKLPMTLSYGYDRMVLERLSSLQVSGRIVISASADKAIGSAINSKREPDHPILEPTDYELMGYLDNNQKLVAKVTSTKLGITKGKSYDCRRLSVTFDSYYSKPKMRVLPMSGQTEVYDNDYKLSGANFGIGFHNDHKNFKTFIDNRDGRGSLKYLWVYFEKPKIKSLKDAYPEKYKKALQTIEFAEIMNNFKCFEGQKEYIASVSLTDSACITAETGCGKTFFAINLDLIKNCRKTLLIAPKGTVRSTDVAAQWMKEFKRFSPDRQVFQLFSMKDYNRIIYEYGELPDGVYFSYHTAFFNGGFEDFPTSWPADERGSKFDDKFDYENYIERNDTKVRVPSGYHRGIGITRKGITCIYKPHLATIVGNIFDMIIIDEAHVMCNMKSLVTRAILKLQAKYKYCLTATPVPNICHNIFSLMGWLAVPNWYQGGMSNARWPFTCDDISNFKELFLSKEIDMTKFAEGSNTRARDAAMISNAPRLLKLLKTIIAYISKAQCNPDLVNCKINTVRVPFGEQQKELYAYNLDLDNIPYESFARAGVQQQRLRGICADPEGREWNNIVESIWNPKTLATMQKIKKLIEVGEQVVHISAFKGQNDIIAKALAEMNVSYSRIDSSTSNHAKQSDSFKTGKTKVMLMGIKCAVGHSFDNCRHLIIGSLEWSYGTFNQALGRIYRLNSPRDVECTIILIKDSIEELMFDRLAQKEDAATICTKGKRVPTSYVNESDAEVFAEHLGKSLSGHWNAKSVPEYDCQEEWLSKLSLTM